MSNPDAQIEAKLKRQIEIWRDNFINTAIRKNNLLNQYPAASDAIVFEVTDFFTYDKFWQIACGRGEVDGKTKKLAEYALWSGNDYTDRRMNPPIGWHSERTGARTLSFLDAIIDEGYHAIVQKGENPICLSFGKLSWYVEKKSDAEADCGEVIVKEIDGQPKEFVRISTPLLLIPVKVNNIGSNYWLRPVEEEDAVFNPALILRYRREGYKLFPLPEGGQLIDKETFDIKAYFDALEQHFKNNKSFTFDKNYVALDKFDYDRICMYRDVLKHGDEIVGNKILRAFYGEELEVSPREVSGLDRLDPLRSYQILDSDTSQNELIERFAQGESFILQGPPGTGKTQTIVNMIAEAVMHGRSVLFVSSKMSALNTVLKKLQLMPNVNIGKHCLLIRGEEENKTLNVTETYGKLQESLNAPRATLDRAAYEENARILKRSREKLVGYHREFYDADNSLRMSVYDLIGRMLLLGYNENFIIPVNFPPAFLHALTREQLEAHCALIDDLEKVLLGIIRRSGSVEKDVWYGYKKFTFERADEVALRGYTADMRRSLEEIDALFAQVGSRCGGTLQAVAETLRAYPLLTVRAVCDGGVTSDIVSLYLRVDLGAEKAELGREIARAERYAGSVKRFYAALPSAPDRPAFDVSALRALLEGGEGYAQKRLSELSAEYERLSAVSENTLYLRPLASAGGGQTLSVKQLSDLVDDMKFYVVQTESRAVLEKELLEGYDAAILDYDYRPLLGKFRTAWAEHVKRNKRPFRFNAHIRGIAGLCRDVTRADLSVTGVYRLLEKLALYAEIREKEREMLAAFAPYGLENLTVNVFRGLGELLEAYLHERENFAVGSALGDTVDFHGYIVGKKRTIRNILDAAKGLGTQEDLTVAALISLVNDCEVVCAETRRIAESSELSRILPAMQRGVRTDWGNLLAVLGIVETLREALHDEQRSLQEDGEIFSQAVGTLVSEGMAACVNRLIGKYRAFYANGDWFESEAADLHAFGQMTYQDFRRWLDMAEDADHITEYVSYKRRVHEMEGTPEGEYFARYAKAGREAFPIGKMRDNYEITLLYSYYEELIRASRYVSYLSGLDGVHTVRAQTEEFVKADRAASRFARAIVDQRLYDRISRNSSLHNYLGAIPKGANVSVRRLLRTRSESVRELAPCIMMSVYSVSKLLAYEQYRFDVVIFDEASQIPTEDALTSIMRTDKQIVIAGDPKQMPAISYFKSKSGEIFPDDDEDDAVNCESIIDFVLNAQKNTIKARMLRMHYRSNHESLIKYSNEHPNLYGGRLITFPSPRPRTEDFGLWDYSLSEDPAFAGKLAGGGGENAAEASVVVGLVRKHFERYPLPQTDEETEKYNSLGVIVFGSRQKKLILGMMEQDALLKRVVACRDPRIFSIATADEIQGDEMSEMVLSLTYGRDPDGKVSQGWGHMNQKDVALRKFNVAVTRARDNLKFVHSVTASDVTSDQLDYIAAYLRQFGAVPACQFVSDRAENTYFVEAIGRICESVVGADRVVYNFGESKNSYRVPISILSADRTRVALGIMCEENRGYAAERNGEREAQGFSVREYSRTCPEILRHHGWNNLYETYAIQWIRNYSVERTELIRRLNSVK